MRRRLTPRIAEGVRLFTSSSTDDTARFLARQIARATQSRGGAESAFFKSIKRTPPPVVDPPHVPAPPSTATSTQVPPSPPRQPPPPSAPSSIKTPPRLDQIDNAFSETSITTTAAPNTKSRINFVGDDIQRSSVLQPQQPLAPTRTFSSSDGAVHPIVRPTLSIPTLDLFPSKKAGLSKEVQRLERIVELSSQRGSDQLFDEQGYLLAGAQSVTRQISAVERRLLRDVEGKTSGELCHLDFPAPEEANATNEQTLRMIRSIRSPNKATPPSEKEKEAGTVFALRSEAFEELAFARRIGDWQRAVELAKLAFDAVPRVPLCDLLSVADNKEQLKASSSDDTSSGQQRLSWQQLTNEQKRMASRDEARVLSFAAGGAQAVAQDIAESIGREAEDYTTEEEQPHRQQKEEGENLFEPDLNLCARLDVLKVLVEHALGRAQVFHQMSGTCFSPLLDPLATVAQSCRKVGGCEMVIEMDRELFPHLQQQEEHQQQQQDPSSSSHLEEATMEGNPQQEEGHQELYSQPVAMETFESALVMDGLSDEMEEVLLLQELRSSSSDPNTQRKLLRPSRTWNDEVVAALDELGDWRSALCVITLRSGAAGGGERYMSSQTDAEKCAALRRSLLQQKQPVLTAADEVIKRSPLALSHNGLAHLVEVLTREQQGDRMRQLIRGGVLSKDATRQLARAYGTLLEAWGKNHATTISPLSRDSNQNGEDIVSAAPTASSSSSSQQLPLSVAERLLLPTDNILSSSQRLW